MFRKVEGKKQNEDTFWCNIKSPVTEGVLQLQCNILFVKYSFHSPMTTEMSKHVAVTQK
jgi:uncharacterized protein YaiI (UPF0178 family)